ncbi:MAG TPA: UDP-3-O-(3-hydroxymyristoyl)glucosamine N-acyltransferase [Phycisphaerae bacterium]|nr:UDP-3-O-(3-hydroxymyristoyl)glucosamine N-acyltransferase [Phycisphaerae bacterium]
MPSVQTTPRTVEQLAQEVGGVVIGDKTRLIAHCNGLTAAGPEDVSFLSNSKYVKHLSITKAGCVVVGKDFDPGKIDRAGLEPLTLIQAEDPYFSFRQILVLLHGFRPKPAPGVSPLAAVARTAKIGRDVSIGPFATVGDNVVIGDRTVLYSGVSVMESVQIGEDCIIYPTVTIYDRSVLGNRVVIQSGASIGCDGYGFATHKGVHNKIPQIGNVVLEDDVEVGANTVIERATLESTLIGKGTKLGNSVVIGHNCQIGEHNLLVSQVGIAGSTNTGKYVVMAGQVGVAGHLNIGDMVRVAAQTGIMQDVEPNQDIGGSPAMEVKRARRVYFHFLQLPELAKRLQAIEEQMRRGETAPRADESGSAEQENK